MYLVDGDSDRNLQNWPRLGERHGGHAGHLIPRVELREESLEARASAFGGAGFGVWRFSFTVPRFGL
jgi:hypothetical protein